MSLWKGLRGALGTVGLYAAVQRIFVAFGCCALPASLLLNAPFGRFGTWGHSWASVNGNAAWFLMEACSPLAFLYGLALPLSTTPYAHLPPVSPSRIWAALTALPPARKLLAGCFLVHYANRSAIGSLRNPGRAPMHVVVPLLSALFNLANGGTIGAWLSAGGRAAGAAGGGSGLKPASGADALFCLGVVLWAAGFVGNIYHDEVLYALKRSKQRSLAKGKRKASLPTAPLPARERYAIPTRGLYSLVSHPAYLCEWVEWAGFALAAAQLLPAPFPPIAAVGALQPLQAWYLQPPVLFLLQEIAAMLPRARSGHKWYRRTFGTEWEEKGARWAVVPGVC